MTDLYKIRDLEWLQHSNGRLWDAETVFGDYAAGINRDGEAWWSDEGGETVWAGDWKEAQAAAEAHYRQRLTQHLEPVPEVVTALRKMRDRHQLYCGGSDMPHAGQSDRALMEEARAALAQVEKADG